LPDHAVQRVAACCAAILWWIAGAATAEPRGGDIDGKGVHVVVSAAADGQEFPVAVLKANGESFIVWHDFRAGDRDIYGQRFDASGAPLWQPNGKPLCALDGSQGWPDVADDPNGGGFFVAWGDSRNGSQDIYAQRFSANGEPLWEPTGVPIAVHATGKDDLTIIADGEGGFIAAWEDWRSGDQDIYGQRVASTGKPLWAPNGSPVCTAPAHQYDPMIDLDGTGGCVVTWWDVSSPEWHAMAQRMSPSGERLWGPEGTRISLSAGSQAGPFVVGDGGGGALVFWTDYRDDDGTYSNIDLYGQHVAPDGSRQWGHLGMPISTAPGNQQNAVGASDGKGGAVVSWVDTRDVFDDIYGQHVLHDGSMAWEADGKHVCTAEGRQRDPRIVIDRGTVVVAWHDFRRETDDETQQDIYLQRLDLSGSRLEPGEGIEVRVGADQSSWLRLHARRGVLLAAWMESGTGDSDVHAWIRRVATDAP